MTETHEGTLKGRARPPRVVGVLQVWQPGGGWEEHLPVLLIPLGRFWELGQQHISDRAQSPHVLSLGP